MNIFKIANFLWDHREKILAFAWFSLILNSITVAIYVYVGEFEMYGVVFWSWVVAMVSFIILNIQYRDPEE